MVAGAEPGKYPSNMGQPWSEEDEETLLTMLQEGKTYEELGTHFQRMPGGIKSRIRKIALEMVEAGAPHARVCESTGISLDVLKGLIEKKSGSNSKAESKAESKVESKAESKVDMQAEILAVLKETRDLLKTFLASLEIKEES